MDRYARASLRCYSEDIDCHVVLKIKGNTFTVVGKPEFMKRAADDEVAKRNGELEEKQAAK